MNSTPIGSRLHIGIFGKRNTGKSTLINALTNQEIAVVSEVPGTTTDPVYKTMEILPVGPVVIIDTAGLDDEGDLGNLRIEKTYDVLRKTNLAVIVINAEEGVTEFEREFAGRLKEKKITGICVVNKCDVREPTKEELKKYNELLGMPVICVSSKSKRGIEELKNAIGNNSSSENELPAIVGDLIKAGDFVVLVTPIDKAAPRGRLILPQQQVTRDIIDADAVAVITKEGGLKDTLVKLGKKPSMVITDSQAFKEVAENTPEDIPLTSFSILIARQKGELAELVKGLKAIKNLKSKSRVLIVEGCTHHRQEGDIGKVKIPGWINRMVGDELEFEWASGTYFPKDIERFDAIVHCGGCMLNRQEMQYRINFTRENNVAITNYGMLIAYVQGILERALEPFPAISHILKQNG